MKDFMMRPQVSFISNEKNNAVNNYTVSRREWILTKLTELNYKLKKFTLINQEIDYDCRIDNFDHINSILKSDGLFFENIQEEFVTLDGQLVKEKIDIEQSSHFLTGYLDKRKQFIGFSFDKQDLYRDLLLFNPFEINLYQVMNEQNQMISPYLTEQNLFDYLKQSKTIQLENNNYPWELNDLFVSKVTVLEQGLVASCEDFEEISSEEDISSIYANDIFLMRYRGDNQSYELFSTENMKNIFIDY